MARNRRRTRPVAAADAPFKGDESGSFRWTLFEGVRRQCRECGREPLLIRDVGEHRTEYPSNTTTFLCVDCQRRNVERFREEYRSATRRLQDRAESKGP